TRLAADRQQFVADRVDRLVPADPRPFAVDEFQRVFEAPFPGNELAHRGALGAMRAAIDRTVPARLLADPHTVGNFRRDGAADRAMGADALADRDLRGGRWRRSGFRSADA